MFKEEKGRNKKQKGRRRCDRPAVTECVTRLSRNFRKKKKENSSF